jgi:thiol-disulfide isomerase/thioredoxin
MKGKLLLLIAPLIHLSLLGYPAYSEEVNLFSKMKIQPIVDKKKIPDLCLEGLNGEKVQLKAPKGKIIFLNFWATWCGPCKEEMPSMEALYQHFKDRNFIFLTIALDFGGQEPVRKFIENYRYQFPVLIDSSGKTLDLFEVSKIPTTLIIDKNGKMIGRVIGPRNWSSPEFFTLIEQMLRDKSSRVVSLKN